MTTADDEATPAEILIATPAPDDAGAETSDRYEWQCMMATADVLSLYFGALDPAGHLRDGADFTVICEHHEDWAVTYGATSEIVSGKHREASVGPFSTIKQLLNDGGILHLFHRWEALGRTPFCRLVTTAGLTGDSARTAKACDELRRDGRSQDLQVERVVSEFCQAITSVSVANGGEAAPVLPDAVRAFLTVLRFQDAQPRRDHLPDMAGQRYGLPIAALMGRAESGSAVWGAVLDLVRPRMRAAGSRRGGALPTVLGVQHDDPLAPRTLTLADVQTAVRFALTHTPGYVPLPRIIKANRMAVKMAQGGCSDNAIERADELRLQYGKYWRARRSSPSDSDQKRRLNNVLRQVLDEATNRVRSEDHLWGDELWRELGDRLRVLEGHSDTQGLSPDLLLGGVSDLANRCHAWYTDRFDVKERLRQILAEEAAAS